MIVTRDLIAMEARYDELLQYVGDNPADPDRHNVTRITVRMKKSIDQGEDRDYKEFFILTFRSTASTPIQQTLLTHADAQAQFAKQQLLANVQCVELWGLLLADDSYELLETWFDNVDGP